MSSSIGICDWCTWHKHHDEQWAAMEKGIAELPKEREIDERGYSVQKGYRELEKRVNDELLAKYGKPVVGVQVGAHCEEPENLCEDCLRELFIDLLKEFIEETK